LLNVQDFAWKAEVDSLSVISIIGSKNLIGEKQKKWNINKWGSKPLEKNEKNKKKQTNQKNQKPNKPKFSKP